MAAKTTVKIIFPLVLFIFPSIFIVLLGPAALTILRGMPNLGQILQRSTQENSFDFREEAPKRDALRLGARAIGSAVELHYLSASPDMLFDRIQKRGMETPPCEY